MSTVKPEDNDNKPIISEDEEDGAQFRWAMPGEVSMTLPIEEAEAQLRERQKAAQAKKEIPKKGPKPAKVKK